MTNVLAIRGTTNSSPGKETRPAPACNRELSFLSGERHRYASNLVSDWEAQLLYLDGVQSATAKHFVGDLSRLINHAEVAPWELRKEHVTRYLESRSKLRPSGMLSPATVGSYCAAWRSFQNFMLELDRVNEIVAQFKVRPCKFVTEENSIAVKKYKANWLPQTWRKSMRLMPNSWRKSSKLTRLEANLCCHYSAIASCSICRFTLPCVSPNSSPSSCSPSGAAMIQISVILATLAR